MRKVNDCAQEAEIEIVIIKKLLQKIKFEVKISYAKGHQNQIGAHRVNSLRHLIKECHKQARGMQETALSKENATNVECHGYYRLIEDRIITSQVIQKIVRIIDARVIEKQHMGKKLEYKVDFIEIKALNVLKTKKVTSLIVKYTPRHYYFGVRDSMINGNVVDKYCLDSKKQKGKTIILGTAKQLSLERTSQKDYFWNY